MSEWGFGFDMELDTPLDFFDVTYKNGEKVRYDKRQHGKWEYLKEHITEMRDADGELNQKDTCRFILNLMGVIEKEGEAE